MWRKKINKLDIFLWVSIGFVVLYTIAEFIFAITAKVSHDVLTGCVYGFFGGEVVSSALIKVFNIKLESNLFHIKANETKEEETYE